jgi:hypothetical protein
VRGDALAQANTAGRGFDYRVCKKTKTQRGWFTGIRYKWLKVAALVTCRFPGQSRCTWNPFHRRGPASARLGVLCTSY